MLSGLPFHRDILWLPLEGREGTTLPGPPPAWRWGRGGVDSHSWYTAWTSRAVWMLCSYGCGSRPRRSPALLPAAPELLLERHLALLPYFSSITRGRSLLNPLARVPTRVVSFPYRDFLLSFLLPWMLGKPCILPFFFVTFPRSFLSWSALGEKNPIIFVKYLLFSHINCTQTTKYRT